MDGWQISKERDSWSIVEFISNFSNQMLYYTPTNDPIVREESQGGDFVQVGSLTRQNAGAMFVDVQETNFESLEAYSRRHSVTYL